LPNFFSKINHSQNILYEILTQDKPFCQTFSLIDKLVNLCYNTVTTGVIYVKFVAATTFADQADIRRQICHVFVEGFYWQLKMLEDDKPTLRAAFEHMFDLSKFYIAEEDGVVASVCCIRGGGEAAVALDATIFRKHMGFFTGSIAFWVLNKNIVKKVFPVDIPQNYGVIDMVSVNPAYAGRGVTKALLTDAMKKSPYDGFILEVLGNNENAIKLYEKLGFTTICRVKGPMFSGAKQIMYMKYDKPEENA